MRFSFYVLVSILIFSLYYLSASEAAKQNIAERSTFVKTSDNRTVYVSALKPFLSCAIVFVHGLLGSSQHWFNQYITWNEKCSTIVYDIYGHGLSTGILKNSDRGVLVKDIKAVLEWSQADKYVLVGHNYGGLAIQQYSYQTRDPKIRAMVLVDTFARNPNPYREGGDEPIISLLASSDFTQDEIVAAARVLINPAKPSTIPQPGWEIIAGSVLITDFAAANQIILTNHTFLDNSFSKPVLIIYGTLDTIANKQNWPELNKAYSNSQLVALKGASHSCFLEFPEQFNIKLQNFLDSISWT